MNIHVSLSAWWLGAGKPSIIINDSLQVQLRIGDADTVWKIHVAGQSLDCGLFSHVSSFVHRYFVTFNQL